MVFCKNIQFLQLFWFHGNINLTNCVFLDYNAHNNAKALKRRVGFGCRSESPGLVRWGAEEEAEHGLGAGVSKRHSRECPLQLFEAASVANQGGTAMTKPSPLFLTGGRFFK